MNRGFYDLLAHLRTHPNCLDRCVGACWGRPRRSVHQGSGRTWCWAANLAGCAFVGRPLVEALAILRNFTVQARNAGCSLEAAYHLAAADLVERVLAFSLPRWSGRSCWPSTPPAGPPPTTLAQWGCAGPAEERCASRRRSGLRKDTLEGTVAGCLLHHLPPLRRTGRVASMAASMVPIGGLPRHPEGDAWCCSGPNNYDALSANLTAAING